MKSTCRILALFAVAAMLPLAGCVGAGSVGTGITTFVEGVGCDLEAGAKIACQVQGTGEPIVQVIDPSIVQHNSTNIARAQAACAAVNAAPVPTVCSPAPSAAAPAAPAGN